MFELHLHQSARYADFLGIKEVEQWGDLILSLDSVGCVSALLILIPFLLLDLLYKYPALAAVSNNNAGQEEVTLIRRAQGKEGCWAGRR